MAKIVALIALVLLVGCAGTSPTPVNALRLPIRQSANGRTERPPKLEQYIYWTNEQNGSVGRAKVDGSGVNETFIESTTHGQVGGAGMTESRYVYGTSANGGTATTILRAKLDGSGVNEKFITGARNPCGVTVSGKY